MEEKEGYSAIFREVADFLLTWYFKKKNSLGKAQFRKKKLRDIYCKMSKSIFAFFDWLINCSMRFLFF